MGREVSPGTHPWSEKGQRPCWGGVPLKLHPLSAPSAYSESTGRTFLEPGFHPGIVLHVSLLEARLRSLSLSCGRGGAASERYVLCSKS